MIRFFLDWLFGRSEIIPAWTPEKAQYYERETLKMLGRGETGYAWSRQFRRSSRGREKVIEMPKRQSR